MDSKERIEDREDVKEALAEIDPIERRKRSPRARKSDKLWFASLVILSLGFLVVLYMVRLNEIAVPEAYQRMTIRLLRGGFFICLVFILRKLVSLYFFSRIEDQVSRYNVTKILNLVSAVFIILIVLSSVFVNWYGAMVSLGVISLILGVALQNPITSFFAWIFLLVRRLYRVGDRIKIGEATGDVVDVGFIDTTLWEFHGDYLSTDHPSGRLIRFPNSKIFSEPVINYSWPLFPYIWNEINLQVGYSTDFKFVSEIMERIVCEELGEPMMQKVTEYKEMLKRTAIDQLEVKERPVVFFRADDVTWIRASVRYLVSPRASGTIKNRLTVRLIEELSKHPDRVHFPNGDNR